MTLARFDRPFIAVFSDEVRALTAESAVLLAYLRFVTHDGPVVLTVSQIAEGIGLTERTTQRHLSRLRERGLVGSERASTWDPTQRWTVLEPAGRPVTPDPAATVGRDVAVRQTGDVAVTPSDLEPKESSPPTPQGEQATLPLLSVVRESVAPETATAVDAEFSGFWAAYPRKVGKGAAERAYRTARRTATVEAIAGGLRGQLPDLRSRPMDKVPHASTWLNQRRWEDDPAHAAQPARAAGPRNALMDPNLMVGFPAVGDGR